MAAQIIFSMCNQSRQGSRRTHCLAALDVDSGALNWIRAGTTRRDFGITGIAADADGIYAAVQTHLETLRVIQFDRHSFRIVSEFPLRHARDPHSLCIHNGDLLLASTGNNAIFHLVRKSGKIIAEELFWRYPGTSDQENDVHVNCLNSYRGDLFATAFGPRNEQGEFGDSGELRNITTDKRCVGGMRQPHSILFHGGRTYCASSATGEVVVASPGNDDWSVKRISLRGYTRGLASWGEKVLVGVSAHRTRSRSRGNTLETKAGHYSESEIILLSQNGEEERVAVDTSLFGKEVYEIINIDTVGVGKFPSPMSNLRLESLRTAIQRSSWR